MPTHLIEGLELKGGKNVLRCSLYRLFRLLFPFLLNGFDLVNQGLGLDFF